jgi:hypothetical protein
MEPGGDVLGMVDVQILFFFGTLNEKEIGVGLSYPVVVDAVVEESVKIKTSDPEIKSAVDSGGIDHIGMSEALISQDGEKSACFEGGIVVFRIGYEGIDFMDEIGSCKFKPIVEVIDFRGVEGFPSLHFTGGAGYSKGIGEYPDGIQFLRL